MAPYSLVIKIQNYKALNYDKACEMRLIIENMGICGAIFELSVTSHSKRALPQNSMGLTFIHETAWILATQIGPQIDKLFA